MKHWTKKHPCRCKPYSFAAAVVVTKFVIRNRKWLSSLLDFNCVVTGSVNVVKEQRMNNRTKATKLFNSSKPYTKWFNSSKPYTKWFNWSKPYSKWFKLYWAWWVKPDNLFMQSLPGREDVGGEKLLSSRLILSAAEVKSMFLSRKWYSFASVGLYECSLYVKNLVATR